MFVPDTPPAAQAESENLLQSQRNQGKLDLSPTVLDPEFSMALEALCGRDRSSSFVIPETPEDGTFDAALDDIIKSPLGKKDTLKDNNFINNDDENDYNVNNNDDNVNNNDDDDTFYDNVNEIENKFIDDNVDKSLCSTYISSQEQQLDLALAPQSVFFKSSLKFPSSSSSQLTPGRDNIYSVEKLSESIQNQCILETPSPLVRDKPKRSGKFMEADEDLRFLESCASQFISSPLITSAATGTPALVEKRDPVDDDASFLRNNASIFLDSPAAASKDDGKDGGKNRKNPDAKLVQDFFGLPRFIVQRLKVLFRVQEMHEWQRDCLSSLFSEDSVRVKNLILSAPTSGGKTLISDILALRNIVSSEMAVSALFVVPFVSLVNERVAFLKKLLSAKMYNRDPAIRCQFKFPARSYRGLRVAGYHGQNSNDPKLLSFDKADIAVCTIEKANSFINRLIEEKTLSRIGVIIIDELHLMGERGRGFLVELLLSKVRHFNTSQSKHHIQIVGMSACIPNLEEIGEWLEDAFVYKSEFRPVPLTQYIVSRHLVYDTRMNVARKLVPFSSLTSQNNDKDKDGLLSLCEESMRDGHGVLVFCPTKDSCAQLSILLSECVHQKFVAYSLIPVPDPKLNVMIEKLRRTPAGLDPILAKTVPHRIAYHHAGLSMEEREILEDGFRTGDLKILAATSTLASGINLPARRVIFQAPYIGRSFLDPINYYQMTGRAGRKNLDVYGESFLIFNELDKSKVMELITSTLKPLKSTLEWNKLCVNRAILEFIVTNSGKSKEELVRFLKHTFFAHCNPMDKKVSSPLQDDAKVPTEGIHYLLDKEFISLQVDQSSNNKVNLTPTKLGFATVASALSPEEGSIVYEELSVALKSFILENELHLVYHVTPIYFDVFPNWTCYLNLYEALPETLKLVGKTVGIKEAFLVQASQGRLPQYNESQRRGLRIHKRFYASLILYDLLCEMPLPLVCQKYIISRGLVQTLQLSACNFAGMVSVFCGKLKWSPLEILFKQFQCRLMEGIQPELLDLVQLPHMKGFRARALYDAGFKSLEAIAISDPQEIQNILVRSLPFQSEKEAGTGVGTAVQIEGAISKRIVTAARQLISSDPGNTVVESPAASLSLINTTKSRKRIARKIIIKSWKNNQPKSWKNKV